jgi:hypothetical protein
VKTFFDWSGVMDVRERVAQTSPEALKKWLVASGRKYMVFNSEDLVDALEWPDQHQLLQRLIDAYREHRRTKPTGRKERQLTLGGQEVPMSVYKGEVLELEEKKELWEQLGSELRLMR